MQKVPILEVSFISIRVIMDTPSIYKVQYTATIAKVLKLDIPESNPHRLLSYQESNPSHERFGDV